ncbi:MAG: Do family serine endopeptidase, partial [Candidatus Omnitrophica bacterium]|nr:Do family serine endopeptidase [Candidatus Omnitrophota bacterium]
PAVTPGVSFEGFGMEDAVINVANTAGKAVVSVAVEQVQKVGGGNARRFYFGRPNRESPFGEDDPFRRFFDDFFGEMPEREFRRMGVGSGVIIDAQGYILTNQHVVDEADKITVTLPDGREFKGELKGQDPRSDLAVIKISAKNLPVAALGDSDNLKIGQWVVAIGNPFGLAMQNPEPTVTSGVVSALHRTLGRTMGRDRDYNDLIQTDAAINPGNSGGPLVNLKGEVIGINVAIYSTSGGYQGVGFAVPINNAKRIISRLIEGKKIEYGWLGITVQDLTDDLAKYFGLSEKQGVLVAGVLADGPAQKAGLRKGDVLKQFDGKPVATVKELLSFVNRSEVGRRIKVAAIRDRKEMSFDVVLAARPQEPGIEEQPQEGEAAAGMWRGIQVADPGSKEAQKFKVRAREGVVVIDVKTDSPAGEAGIIPGDLILEVNRQKVNSVADFEKVTAGVKGDCLVATGRGFIIVKEKSEN